jgi:hypothetical protein
MDFRKRHENKSAQQLQKMVGRVTPCAPRRINGKWRARSGALYLPQAILFPGNFFKKRSHRNRRLDARMRIVAHQFEILEFEVVNILHCGIQFHRRQRAWFA